MTNSLLAKASPEKRLFISLITRDIPLIAAFLDLIDNSINSAVEPFSSKLQTADDYLKISLNSDISPSVNISLKVSPESVEISDTAAGISAQTAVDHVFKFGRASDEAHVKDRLSVYGIGLKRAIFKLGNQITISSDHVEGGFDLILNVAEWERDTTQPWTFSITPREPVDASNTGTRICVSDLYDECKRRLSDGVFLGQLRDSVARTYAFYLSKFVKIEVNEQTIEGIDIQIGSNHASDEFTDGNVSCAITAGIGIAQNGMFRDRSSGWFVFCNGRTVISADKGPLTGWGTGSTGLPIFQPKHRPFLGTVFFVSHDAEKLPWTTTKSGINEDSAIWQEAKRYMASVGRTVTSFLDGRYTDEGTEVDNQELKDAAGTSVSIMSAAVSPKQTFVPVQKQMPETMKIQYDAKINDVILIAKYLGRPSMSGADVGKHTFNYFLRNEVEEN